MNNYIKITTAILPLSLFALTSGADSLNFHDGIPMMVDSKIELNDIFLEDKDITYTYQLKDIRAEDAENAKEEYQFFIEKKACDDENIRYLFKKDVNLKFIYKVDAQEILQVHIDKNFCDRLAKQDWVL